MNHVTSQTPGRRPLPPRLKLRRGTVYVAFKGRMFSTCIRPKPGTELRDLANGAEALAHLDAVRRKFDRA